jgi:hydroxymethylbilane synthase
MCALKGRDRRRIKVKNKAERGMQAETRANRLRIGTRGSPLALWQAGHVRDLLVKAHPGIEVEIVPIQTKGDRALDTPLATVGSKGLFTREIEQALLSGAVDLAVHSLKDLPTTLPARLMIGAVCEREDPLDCLVTKGARSLVELRAEAVVATGSPRRKAQLLHLRPDLRIVDLRGNVGTRLRKLDESDWDAIVLAKAGLVRLGFENRIHCVLSQKEMLPAVCQGALGIEIRQDDSRTAALVSPLDHAPTRLATAAERAFLASLGGGCQVPIAALARVGWGTLSLEGLVASPDGRMYLRRHMEGPASAAEALGKALGAEILEEGGGAILGKVPEKTSDARKDKR